MPYLNLYLHSNQQLEKEKVVDTGLMFNKNFPTNWTNAQLKVLDNILCNIINAHTNNKILYYQRAMPNVIPRYNPLGLGHKVMTDRKSGVLWKLHSVKLIRIKVGDNPYLVEDGEPAEMSEFVWFGNGAIEFANLLGISKETIHRAEGTHHVVLKKGTGQTLIDYKDTKFTKHVESTMKEYCEYLNSYNIKDLGLDEVNNIMLRRTFRDYDNSGVLKFNGRSGRYWHDWSKARRARITINGKPVSQEPLDFTSSQINILYAWRFDRKLEQKDQYQIDGFAGANYRKLIKQLTVMMLNTRNSKHCAKAFTHWLGGTSEYLYKRQQEEKAFFPIYKMQKLIREKHSEIADLFYQPLIGRNLEFLEAGIIFEIALQCCRQGIPALTVHDELVVCEEDRDVAEMIMNSTYIDRSLYKSVF